MLPSLSSCVAIAVQKCGQLCCGWLQRPRRELDAHLLDTFDEHQLLVVRALTRAGAVIAGVETDFDRRLTALQDRAERLVVMYETPLHWCVEPWTYEPRASCSHMHAPLSPITTIWCRSEGSDAVLPGR